MLKMAHFEETKNSRSEYAINFANKAMILKQLATQVERNVFAINNTANETQPPR